MYKIISLLSLLIRQFCLPNPFKCFGDSALLINWIAGIVMASITYLIVGLVYDKGSEPAVGRSIFSFAWWWILILVATFIGAIIGIRSIGEKIEASRFRN